MEQRNPKHRTLEIAITVAIILIATIAYIGRRNDWFPPIVLGTAASIVVIILIAASLGWILYRTIRGHQAERRIVFLYIGFAVALPLFMSLTQKITISPEVQDLYDGIARLQPGSKVLATFDYDPPSAPELQPMAESFFRYAFQRDLKVIVMGLWPQGPQQANLALTKILAEDEFKNRGLQYGVDYVNLGFQSGNEFVIQRMGTSIRSMFPTDAYGVPYDSLPLVRNVKNFDNIDYSINFSAGYPGTKEWVLVAVDRYGLDLGAGNTAVQVTEMYPYVRSGQLIGILGGMNGAAEFEKITEQIGKGTRFMLSQSFAHMVVIAFILIGNVAYFTIERRGRNKP